MPNISLKPLATVLSTVTSGRSSLGGYEQGQQTSDLGTGRGDCSPRFAGEAGSPRFAGEAGFGSFLIRLPSQ